MTIEQKAREIAEDVLAFPTQQDYQIALNAYFEGEQDGYLRGRRDAIQDAARVADPPLMHRKGPVGLWRKRRAEIATAIRALIEEQKA
jgi:hypothetical protein